MYNQRRLFVASCLALITSAFTFQMRADSADDFRTTFGLTQEMVGAIMGGQFLGMATAMLVFSFLCDFLGMGKVLGLAWLCHLVGITGTIFAQDVAGQGFAQSIGQTLAGMSGGWSPLPDAAGDKTGFWVLWVAAFITGAGNGLVEISINPLAATLFPDNKTHKLNVLHAWWPGGLIIAGLIAQFLVNPLYGRKAEFLEYTLDPSKLGLASLIPSIPVWQFKYGLAAIPWLLYGLLAVGQSFPATERVQANVSAGTMFLQIFRPMFILWAFCMLLTAGTELGTNAWMESILKRTAHVSGTVIFIYTSMLMFVLRFFAGPIAHAFSPVGMLFFCSILTTAGLYGLSVANTAMLAFAAATVFGVGITYYWPTMLGVTAERFPKGGALVLGLMGCIGNIAVSQASPQIGKVYDSASVANLPSDMQAKPYITEGEVPNLPPEVSKFLYPAGGKKLNPEVVASTGKDTPAGESITKAEAAGASFALTRVSVMPAVLVLIFGLIALLDKMQGGYKAVHITGQPTLARAAPPAAGKWPRDMTR